MKKTRLHQFLSRTGLFRNKTELINAVKNSEIKIDNKLILNPQYQFNPKNKKVFWKNKIITSMENRIYILMNKPENYLSSKLSLNDIRMKKKSVFDLIKLDEKMNLQTKNTLFCIGRLDENTSGLLIITNDGELSSRIASPESRIKKSYEVLLENPIEQKTINEIQQGIIIDLEENNKIIKYRTKPCSIIPDKNSKKQLTITVSEGKKREIRRIFEKFKNKVIQLERTAIENIKLKELNLKKGQYIYADKKFIEQRL